MHVYNLLSTILGTEDTKYEVCVLRSLHSSFDHRGQQQQK